MAFETQKVNKANINTLIYHKTPDWLLDMWCHNGISAGAYKVYLVMFSRLNLSIMHNWVDKEDEYYIKYSYAALQEKLNCSAQTISTSIKCLIDAGLLRQKKNFSATSTYFLSINPDFKKNLGNDKLEEFELKDNHSTKENLSNDKISDNHSSQENFSTKKTLSHSSRKLETSKNTLNNLNNNLVVVDNNITDINNNIYINNNNDNEILKTKKNKEQEIDELFEGLENNKHNDNMSFILKQYKDNFGEDKTPNTNELRIIETWLNEGHTQQQVTDAFILANKNKDRKLTLKFVEICLKNPYNKPCTNSDRPFTGVREVESTPLKMKSKSKIDTDDQQIQGVSGW